MDRNFRLEENDVLLFFTRTVAAFNCYLSRRIQNYRILRETSKPQLEESEGERESMIKNRNVGMEWIFNLCHDDSLFLTFFASDFKIFPYLHPPSRSFRKQNTIFPYLLFLLLQMPLKHSVSSMWGNFLRVLYLISSTFRLPDNQKQGRQDRLYPNK